MAVVVAVAMIMVVAMVVVMMTFTGEKHRQQEHQAGDEGRGLISHTVFDFGGTAPL